MDIYASSGCFLKPKMPFFSFYEIKYFLKVTNSRLISGEIYFLLNCPIPVSRRLNIHAELILFITICSADAKHIWVIAKVRHRYRGKLKIY